MSKQTAVEWYEKEINSLIEKYEAKEFLKREFITMKHNLFYDAKEMEKEQIIEAHGAKQYHKTVSGEQYYNETYKKEEK
jgi:hypothetical protein